MVKTRNYLILLGEGYIADLTESYYDINKFKTMLQENLGEKYTGDINRF
ncbi:hypothetical protein [Acetivibrio clariflavus]|nr:hypothetical protein [Acetivibrio clariflavus]